MFKFAVCIKFILIEFEEIKINNNHEFIKKIMQDFRLKIFYTAAKNLSFTKTSQELFISQPAVTKNIQMLENFYGLRLFNRKGNKIHLTQAGKILFDYTKKINALHRKLENELNLFKENNTGALRVGASTTIAQYVIPPVLADFKKKNDGIKLSLVTGNSEQIADALLNEVIDIGLVEGKVKSRDIRYQTLMKDELVLTASTNIDLQIPDQITLSQLSKLPLVLRERGSGTLEVIEFALKHKKIKITDLNIAMYLGSTEAIKYYLSSANSASIISLRAIQKELEAGLLKIIRIKNFNVKRTFDFITLQGSSLSGNISIFIKFTKKYYNF